MDAGPPAERRRAPAEVDRHVEYFTHYDPHELPLRLPDLVMQPAQHAPARARMVVLHEICLDAGLLPENALVHALEEEPALVPEHPRLDYQDFGYIGADDVHQPTATPALRASSTRYGRAAIMSSSEVKALV